MEGTSDKLDLWNRFIRAFESTEQTQRQGMVLFGILRKLRSVDTALAAKVLDDAVDHPALGEWYPALQVTATLEAQDIHRLKRSVITGRVPAWRYMCLSSGRATDPIPASDLKDLLLAIAEMPEGHAVAVEILHARLYLEKPYDHGVPSEIADIGRKLLQQLNLTRQTQRDEYRWRDIVSACLQGEDGQAVVFETCQRLKRAVLAHETYAFHHDDLLTGLFCVHPTAALEGLCGGNVKDLNSGVRILEEIGHRRNPLDAVPDDTLSNWCDQSPQVRYTALARIITAFRRDAETSPPYWTSIAIRFFDRAPDAVGVLRKFVSSFAPLGGAIGSRAPIIESNMTLLNQLSAYPALAPVLNEQRALLREWIEQEHSQTMSWDRAATERFE